MHYQIPSILAITLVVSVSLLTVQLVMNQSQSIETEYSEANMYDAQAHGQRIQLKQ